MYRPEGWEERYPNPCTDCDNNSKYLPRGVREGSFCVRCEQDNEYEIFQAGADAMLKGLKGDTPSKLYETSKLSAKEGWWVFIPEEGKNGTGS